MAVRSVSQIRLVLVRWRVWALIVAGAGLIVTLLLPIALLPLRIAALVGLLSWGGVALQSSVQTMCLRVHLRFACRCRLDWQRQRGRLASRKWSGHDYPYPDVAG